MTLSSTWLVIGYGNSLRRDDGAGLLLAAALADIMAQAGVAVRLLRVQQLLPELAEELAAPDLAGAIFVDAAPAQVADEPVRVMRLCTAARGSSMGHHVAPELLVTMAAQLYDGCAPAWLVTIPGWDFDHGDGVSQEVRTRLAQAPAVWESIAGGV